MKYQDASGLSQKEIADWDYDKAQEEADAKAALEEADRGEFSPSDAQSLPSEEYSGPTISNADVARTEQKSELDSGVVSQVGEAIQYALDGGIGQDLMNAGASALNTLSGGNLNGVDDAVLSYDEQKDEEVRISEIQDKARADGELSGVEAFADSIANATEGLADGATAGVMLPATLAARVANQDASWSDPPETLKNSPVGESVFKIAEVMVPTLLSGGIAGTGAAGTGLGGLALESGIETVTQRSSDDLIRLSFSG